MTRVLVVDDEIDTLNLLRTILEISGYEAFTTLNSLDALTLAEVERPDLILLDIMMPNLDGFTLCKMMRQNPTTKDLPIVFVTAYSSLDLEERRADAGADMVLPKPIGMDTLIDAVDKATSIRKEAAPAGSAGSTGSGVIMISLDDQPVIATPPASPETSTSATATATHPVVAAPTVAPVTAPKADKDEITFSIGGSEALPPVATPVENKPATPPSTSPPPAPAPEPTPSASTPPTPETKPPSESAASPDKPASDASPSVDPTNNKPLA